MKRIIAIISLVLMLAVSLTACGGKKDYKNDAKVYTFENLKITLTESFDTSKREIKEGDTVTGVTYTSASGTSVTIDKLENSIHPDLAENDLEELEALTKLGAKIIEIDGEKIGTGKTKGQNQADDATADDVYYSYFIFTVKNDGTEYVYLRAFMNSGNFSYRITFSTTKAAYDGKDDYDTFFMNWLNTATITVPESSEGN